MAEQEHLSKEHCEHAISVCQQLAALPQHPMSRSFWRGRERLWRERLRQAEQESVSFPTED